MESQEINPPPAPTVSPTAPTPGQTPHPEPPKSSQQKLKRLQLVMILLVVGVVVLAVAAIFFAARSSSNATKAQTAYQEGQTAGANAQKSTDEQQYAHDQQTDTRTYIAPDAYGAFHLTLPKLYNLMVTPGASGAFTALADPSQVDTKNTEQAFRLTIQTSLYDQVRKTYDGLTKDKRANVTAQDVTVSGIQGTQYTGLISQGGTTASTAGTVVLLPVRDKTYILQTDNNQKYLSTFQQILSQIKIFP